MQELSDRIDQVGHIFTKVDWIDICLCRDWQGNARNPDDVRQYGFPEQMYLLLSKRFGGNPQSGFLFPTSQILPALQTSHDPHVLVLTSLHCDGQILGFTAMGFQDSRAVRIDETYVSWCDAVSNGLKVLQQRIRAQPYPHHLEQLETDPVTGMLNRGGFLFRLPEVTAGYLKAGNRCVLLLLTYYPDQINQLDPAAAIGEAIRSYHTHRLCCRIEDSIFAVLMPMQPGENEAASIVDLTAFVENSLRVRFKIRQVPEFIDYTVQLTSTSRKAVEQRKVSDMFKVTRGYVLAATLTNDTKSDEMSYPVYSSQTKDFGLMGYYRDYLYENSITWTTDGANAGTVNYRAGKFYCTNVCGVLLSDKVNASQMIAEALNNVAKGYVSYVGNPKLMNNVMSDIEIMIPVSPMEQKRISDYFATLDHLITLHQRKCNYQKKSKKIEPRPILDSVLA